MPSYIELDKNGLAPSSSGAGTLLFGLDVYGNIVLIDNNGNQVYKSTNLGRSAVGGDTVNLGTSNLVRSSLGISFGSFNNIGGILYTASLQAGSTWLTSSGDLTDSIAESDFLYVTNEARDATQIIQVHSINYDAGSTYINLTSSIDNISTTASFSQTVYGINTLALGTQNILQGNNALAVGGNNQILQYSNNSVVIGAGNIANKSNNLISGVGGSSRFTSDRTLSSVLNKQGDCQSTEVMMGCITTDDTRTELKLYGNQRLVLPITNSTGSAYAYKVEVLAMRVDDTGGGFGQSFTRTINGLIVDRNSTVEFIGDPVESTPIKDPEFYGSVLVSADNTNKCLKIEATGETDKTIKWVAKVTLIQTYN